MRLFQLLFSLLLVSLPCKAFSGFNDTSGLITFYIIGSNGDMYLKVSGGAPTVCTNSGSYILIPRENQTATSMVLMLIATQRSADFYVDHNDPNVAKNCRLNMIQGR